MTGITVLNGSIQQNLFAIQKAQRLVDDISTRLASGKRVNQAIDQPQNFFAARTLTHRASDFSRILDGISQNIRKIEEADHGLKALSRLLEQADAIADTSLNHLQAGTIDPNVYEREIGELTPLSDLIQADNPVAYYRLNDAGGTAANLGTGGGLNATYVGGASSGAEALYRNGGEISANFDGVNDGVRIPDSALINTSTHNERTVELVFNADDVGARQVLYEEGAQVNGFTIYIDNGRLYITAEDDGNYADINISSSILAGRTYHTAFVFDRFSNSFTGYLNGEEIGSVTVGNQIFPSHSGDVGIGYAPDGVQFHDGESNGGGFYFDGRISDVAIYNAALDANDILTRHKSLNGTVEFRNREFENVLEQMNTLVEDAHYRGISLLQGEDLVTVFNPDGTSKLIAQGFDFSFGSLGIQRVGFDQESGVRDIIDSVRGALEQVRSFGRTLQTDLLAIKTRQNFTRELINSHLAGSDDLTNADINKEGANFLAAQTRLNLAQTSLSIAAQSNAAILSLFSEGTA